MKIVFCLPGKSFSGTFLKCWSDLLYSCLNRGITPIISQHYSPVVYYVRNMCLGGDSRRGINQKAFDNKFEYDYTMWIDSDMVFNSDDFFKLLESAEKGFPIMSGLYLINNESYAAVEKWDEDYFLQNGAFNFISKNDILAKKYADDPIIKVSYNGFGFMLIKKEVLDSMEYPWFRPNFVTMTSEDGDGVIKDFTSEDASFCINAAKKGYPTWVNTEVILGHEKPVVLY